jgi:DNA-directed RNA polymerase subunit H (RpoH/RPB5)
MSISISEPWEDYGYLSNRYPSPFNARGRRWRNVNDFVLSEGDDRNTLLEGVTEKFRSNSHLLVELEGTGESTIVGEGDLPSVLMEVRSNLSDKSVRETSSFKRMMVSLEEIIKKEGFTGARLEGKPIELSEVQEGDHKIEIHGNGKKGVIDLILSVPITDKKIKTIIDPAKSKGLSDLYIIVGSLSRNTITRSLAAMSSFHQIRYFSGSELLIEYSKHILTPRVEVVSDDDPIHSIPRGHLPEISMDDPFLRQLGIRKTRSDNRLIIAVHDHSPHYREIV